MALTTEILAPFIAVSVIAGDGIYGGVEQECVKDLEEDLQLDGLNAAAEAEFAKVLEMDDDELDDYLVEAAEQVSDKEAVLLICLNVLSADLLISVNELSNYFAFAEILEVSEDRASEILEEFIDEVDDLIIEDGEDE